jgi:CysZ protein
MAQLYQYCALALFALVVLLGLFFGFSILANLIASPFYGFLAEKVAEKERGEVSPPTSLRDIMLVVPHSVVRELRKIGYYLPRLLILLLLSFVPVVNLVSSPLLLLFGVWMMAVQYIDFQADNDQVSFIDMLRWMRGRRMLSLGFGLPVYVGMLIPLVNLLHVPLFHAAVGANAGTAGTIKKSRFTHQGTGCYQHGYSFCCTPMLCRGYRNLRTTG